MARGKGHYINVKQTLEIEVRMRHKILTIRGIDPAMSIVDIRVVELLAWGSVQLDSLGSDSLPRGESIGACFDGIGGCHKLLTTLSLPDPKDRQQVKDSHRSSLQRCWCMDRDTSASAFQDTMAMQPHAPALQGSLHMPS